MAVGIMFKCEHRMAIALEDVLLDMACPFCGEKAFHPDLDLSRAKRLAQEQADRLAKLEAEA